MVFTVRHDGRAHQPTGAKQRVKVTRRHCSQRDTAALQSISRGRDVLVGVRAHVPGTRRGRPHKIRYAIVTQHRVHSAAPSHRSGAQLRRHGQIGRGTEWQLRAVHPRPSSIYGRPLACLYIFMYMYFVYIMYVLAHVFSPIYDGNNLFKKEMFPLTIHSAIQQPQPL